MIARNLASLAPWFAKPCTTPRGMQMLSPGATSDRLAGDRVGRAAD